MKMIRLTDRMVVVRYQEMARHLSTWATMLGCSPEALGGTSGGGSGTEGCMTRRRRTHGSPPTASDRYPSMAAGSFSCRHGQTRVTTQMSHREMAIWPSSMDARIFKFLTDRQTGHECVVRQGRSCTQMLLMGTMKARQPPVGFCWPWCDQQSLRAA